MPDGDAPTADTDAGSPIGPAGALRLGREKLRGWDSNPQPFG
jgi:hypothetical protein